MSLERQYKNVQSKIRSIVRNKKDEERNAAIKRKKEYPRTAIEVRLR